MFDQKNPAHNNRELCHRTNSRYASSSFDGCGRDVRTASCCVLTTHVRTYGAKLDHIIMHRTCDPPQIHKPIGRRRRRHLPAQSGGRITYPRSPPRARGRRPFIYLPAAQSPAGRVDGNVDGWQHQARLPARARAQGYTRLARGRTRSLWCLSPCKRVDFRRTPADACPSRWMSPSIGGARLLWPGPRPHPSDRTG